MSQHGLYVFAFFWKQPTHANLTSSDYVIWQSNNVVKSENILHRLVIYVFATKGSLWGGFLDAVRPLFCLVCQPPPKPQPIIHVKLQPEGYSIQSWLILKSQ